jgi:hypothetical protein
MSGLDMLGMVGLPDWMPALPRWTDLIALRGLINLAARAVSRAFLNDPWGDEYLKHYFYDRGQPKFITTAQVRLLVANSSPNKINVWRNGGVLDAVIRHISTGMNQTVVRARMNLDVRRRGVGQVTFGRYALFMSGVVKCENGERVFDGKFEVYDQFDFRPSWNRIRQGRSFRNAVGQARVFVMWMYTVGHDFEIHSNEIPIYQKKSEQEGTW